MCEHIITTDQIRAAWDQTHNPASNGVYARGAENALKELGIVRCDGCSDGYSAGWLDGKPCLLKHKDCNGEGFLVGGEDE